MTLLQEIQESATENEASVAVVLRKCKILAARLDHTRFAEWVEWELNGYTVESPDLLPEYRRIRGIESRAHAIGPFGMQNTAAVIPPAAIDEEHQALFDADLYQSTAVLESIVRGAEGPNLNLSWPGDFLAYYQERIFPQMVMISAWKIVPKSIVDGALDAVRNRVLSFVLEIERENPDAGEAPIGSAPVAREHVDRAFILNIMGGTNVISTGDIDNVVQLPRGDWSELRTELGKLGLERDEIAALSVALAADRQALERGEIGPATQGWLGGITARIRSGALDVASNASGDLVAGIVLRHLGIG